MSSGSGYYPCVCRDCFDISIGLAVNGWPLCLDCEDAGCDVDGGECQRADAYDNNDDCC
ncbi:hypothetical protein LTV02_17925 [Nocardia yamanashiensis]|uniref:hypothetical protein n=1 Tax=Nocardia yamanashiensis TaxID=209247 RepID=UPI001E544329|nr:hypothetical protein [Nocardia yamanashiensis]UGT45150.1 hypothetical protein LTV02_17925 [Nocardia yamanashiensis]